MRWLAAPIAHHVLGDNVVHLLPLPPPASAGRRTREESADLVMTGR
jgi:hypothetical protein